VMTAPVCGLSRTWIVFGDPLPVSEAALVLTTSTPAVLAAASSEAAMEALNLTVSAGYRSASTAMQSGTRGQQTSLGDEPEAMEQPLRDQIRGGRGCRTRDRLPGTRPRVGRRFCAQANAVMTKNTPIRV
jgi:hypothetical protein